MAELNTKTFAALVQGQAAAIQARAAGLVDFTVGSVLRAFVEAVSGVALWLQALILQLLATTRLSTSPTAADADSFVFDFGGAYPDGDGPAFARLPAAAATGQVTFSRFTTGGTASVDIGATVETADGAYSYEVVLDIANPAYDADANAYVMGAGVGAVSVPVQCVTKGAGGNAAAGQISVISSAIAGVDTVTNAAALTNGADAETTDDMKVRFRAWIRALREATKDALAYYVTSIQPGVVVKLIQNKTLLGATHRGLVTLIVDDGTGFPPSALIDAASATVDAHCAAGVEYAVMAPTVAPVAVAGTLVFTDGSTSAQQAAAAAAAVAAAKGFLNGLAIGEDVVYAKLYQAIFNASAHIKDVTGLLVAGGAVNVAIGLGEVAKAGTVAIA